MFEAIRFARIHQSWIALLPALLVYVLLLMGQLKGFSLIDPLQPIWHVAAVLLGLSLMGAIFARRTAKLLAPVKFLVGSLVFLSVALYVLVVLFGNQFTQEVEGQSAGAYAVVRRGGMGSSWTDVVERRVYGFILVRERNIVQYDRENVIRIDDSEQGKLRIHLQELGKPDRVDVIPVG